MSWTILSLTDPDIVVPRIVRLRPEDPLVMLTVIPLIVEPTGMAKPKLVSSRRSVVPVLTERRVAEVAAEPPEDSAPFGVFQVNEDPASVTSVAVPGLVEPVLSCAAQGRVVNNRHRVTGTAFNVKIFITMD
jgi:hypothetical protein